MCRNVVIAKLPIPHTLLFPICVSYVRKGHANLRCIVPILLDDETPDCDHRVISDEVYYRDVLKLVLAGSPSSPL